MSSIAEKLPLAQWRVFRSEDPVRAKTLNYNMVQAPKCLKDAIVQLKNHIPVDGKMVLRLAEIEAIEKLLAVLGGPSELSAYQSVMLQVAENTIENWKRKIKEKKV